MPIMKITGQYGGVTTYHSEYNNYTSFKGLKFKTPKLIADIFVKQHSPAAKGVTKIRNMRQGEFGSECKDSLPLESFEELSGVKELEKLYKKGISTNVDGWADCFLKSSAENPVSTSSVYDCSVMYLFNKQTNTHFLYHSYYNTSQKEFVSMIKTFMPEGVTNAELLPGERRWYMRHAKTLPEMLKALKSVNKEAVVNVRHYSSDVPEIVGYKGKLFEIINRRTALGLSDKGQASFKICDLRLNSFLSNIDYNASYSLKRIAVLRKLYAEKGLDDEILKIVNRLLDKYQQNIEQMKVPPIDI